MNYSYCQTKNNSFIPGKTILLLLLIIWIWLDFGAGSDVLIYDRAKINQGEYWRLISCHFVHIDIEHLALNLGALLLVGGLLEYLQQALFIPVLISGILFVSLGLWFGLTTLLYYCGFSGVLNSLLFVVFWRLWNICQDPVILLLAYLAIIKIVFEIMSNDALFSSISWPPIPETHLLGGLGGLSGLSLLSLRSWLNKLIGV